MKKSARIILIAVVIVILVGMTFLSGSAGIENRLRSDPPRGQAGEPERQALAGVLKPQNGKQLQAFVSATVEINPQNLNLKSRGKWVTVYIELPEGYDVTSIDLGTLILAGAIPADARPLEAGDEDGDGILDLTVKFSRHALSSSLAGMTGPVTLSVNGALTDGTAFEGSDTITVKRPGKQK